MHHLPLPRPPIATPPGSSSVRRPIHPYQLITAELRTAIQTGALPPGTELPTVTQLGARHQVAPSTAHRAIAVLAAEHLVIVSRGKRAVINSVGANHAHWRAYFDTGGVANGGTRVAGRGMGPVDNQETSGYLEDGDGTQGACDKP